VKPFDIIKCVDNTNILLESKDAALYLEKLYVIEELRPYSKSIYTNNGKGYWASRFKRITGAEEMLDRRIV
jgi:hypothetical protein